MRWKKRRLMIIPKKSGPDGSIGWRPLCILSLMAKLFEYCLKDRLLRLVTFRENQYGFCRGKSTILTIVDIIHIWDSDKRKG